MHISYKQDVDALLEGKRGMHLEQIMTEAGLQWDRGTFCLDATPDRLTEAVTCFGQALTRICDLTLLS